MSNAGHSKWHNIQRRKNAQDAKKGKFSCAMRRISIPLPKRVVVILK